MNKAELLDSKLKGNICGKVECLKIIHEQNVRKIVISKIQFVSNREK